MKITQPSETVAQMFWPVKSSETSSIDDTPNSMIHHKVFLSRNKKLIVSYGIYKGKPYGVSRSHRILSPGLLVKKLDHVRDFLQYTLGLTMAQREVTLRLLSYWAYYAQVYVKEAQLTSEPGCSKATYWRTMRLLRSLGLIRTIPRFVIRPHAQISNLYKLDKLVLLIARYLAEHGVAFWEKWLKPYLSMPGSHFWALAFDAARETDFEGRLILPSFPPPGLSK